MVKSFEVHFFFVTLQPKYIKNSTFAKEEVKEFKEVGEVQAICFIAKYTTKRLLAITSNDRRE